ncbi:hypothetical protein [Actinocrispum wychmicini]|uniref:Uncharacterized protein n=1 Tax=Actinocrispum wychmicini TaxID=1213861 RepID=A0A4R2J8V8_9PSEU|nr:hypothetical protein [Actinocrispum wychmicini]TCO55741.1 hypothetical protein EV192_107164 [Actinocrispum wychmicini]
MRSFATRAWSPLGARPHVFVVMPELAVLGDAYLAQVAHWWTTTRPRDPRPVIRPVPARYLHLTLA